MHIVILCTKAAAGTLRLPSFVVVLAKLAAKGLNRNTWDTEATSVTESLTSKPRFSTCDPG